MLDLAAEQDIQLVVFPELTFTTFFPRYIIRDEAELDAYFEHESPVNGIVDSPGLSGFFVHAKKLGIDITVGYAEKTPDGVPYNTSCYVSCSKVINKYRKVHLPGTFEPFDEDPLTTNQLEKRLSQFQCLLYHPSFHRVPGILSQGISASRRSGRRPSLRAFSLRQNPAHQ